jgi:hypothetical protein
MLYCGNNRNHPKLLNGVLGTRYSCLKSGIGVGRNLGFDSSYLNDYDPIDNRKAYCGNNQELPEDYNHFGSLMECYRKGVGVGKKQKSQMRQYNFQNKNDEPKKLIRFSYKIELILLLLFLVFLVFYFLKPKFIKKEQGKEEIDWKKFSLYLIALAFLIIIIIRICL